MELDTDYIKDNVSVRLELPSLSADLLPSASNITKIDPNGDLILEVGDRSLLVSSKVLSIASPVFRTMLGPNFKEGENLSQR